MFRMLRKKVDSLPREDPLTQVIEVGRILIAATLAVAMLTACAPVTIERTGNFVVVTASGSVLGYSATKIIGRAHEAMDQACVRQAHVSMETDSNGNLVASFWHPTWGDLVEIAGKAAEEAKAILGLFGSHSYTARLGCPPPALLAKTSAVILVVPVKAQSSGELAVDALATSCTPMITAVRMEDEATGDMHLHTELESAIETRLRAAGIHGLAEPGTGPIQVLTVIVLRSEYVAGA